MNGRLEVTVGISTYSQSLCFLSLFFSHCPNSSHQINNMKEKNYQANNRETKCKKIKHISSQCKLGMLVKCPPMLQLVGQLNLREGCAARTVMVKGHGFQLVRLEDRLTYGACRRRVAERLWRDTPVRGVRGAAAN